MCMGWPPSLSAFHRWFFLINNFLSLYSTLLSRFTRVEMSFSFLAAASNQWFHIRWDKWTLCFFLFFAQSRSESWMFYASRRNWKLMHYYLGFVKLTTTGGECLVTSTATAMSNLFFRLPLLRITSQKPVPMETALYWTVRYFNLFCLLFFGKSSVVMELWSVLLWTS